MRQLTKRPGFETATESADPVHVVLTSVGHFASPAVPEGHRLRSIVCRQSVGSVRAHMARVAARAGGGIIRASEFAGTLATPPESSIRSQRLAYVPALANSMPTNDSSPTTRASCPGGIVYDSPGLIVIRVPSVIHVSI